MQPPLPPTGPRPAGAASAPSPDLQAILAKLSPDQMKSFMAQSVTPGAQVALPRPAAAPAAAPLAPLGPTQLPPNLPTGGLRGAGFVQRAGGPVAGADARSIEAQQARRLALMKLGVRDAGAPAARPIVPAATTTAPAAQAAPPPTAAPAPSASTAAPAPTACATDPQATWFAGLGTTPDAWLATPPAACAAWLQQHGVPAVQAAGQVAWLDAYAAQRTGRGRSFVVPAPAGQVAAVTPQPLGTTLPVALGIAALGALGVYAYTQLAEPAKKGHR